MNRPTEGIATDGAHSIKNSLTSYRGVDLRTGEQLFREHIGNQTINIGEFLGVVEAVKYIIENDYHPKVVYTDSITAMAWIRNKKTASRKKYPNLKKAEIFLKAMSTQVDQIQVIHWNNDVWGETPADFGLK
ncbi:ribonuclease HI [Dysgonomonas alginatilytica]|uniref:Ribonuclease HI n=1 Tax=Dysgonomonas alginatilytica TaxID=1605892 RepID=A0A2V3PJI9_9BACT|nr:reverse transcriptase-like protein [Dysgonomonas alginatilytica]PXV57441.1 ribonuclease HI [Dysgonomonas alginatilytica]